METRTAKVQMTKVGGTASKNALKCRVQIPTAWAKDMGLDDESRNINLTYDNATKEVTIRRRDG